MTEKEYFKIFLASVDVKNKKVLEIGGAVPPEWISDTGVSSWTSIDITENRFKGLQPGDALPEWYKPVKMDAADMTFADATFDIVYTTNCFEHVWDLTSVLDHTYRVLKPQGILFSIFSPIWSSPVGHHTWVWDGDTPLVFDQNIFPDWYHLVKTEKELKDYLSPKYRPKIVEDICHMVYKSHSINRLKDTDYEDGINRYDYSNIVKFRLRSRKKPSRKMQRELESKCPGVNSFRTLGYVWILCKGEVSPLERVRAFALGGFTAVWQKIVS